MSRDGIVAAASRMCRVSRRDGGVVDLACAAAVYLHTVQGACDRRYGLHLMLLRLIVVVVLLQLMSGLLRRLHRMRILRQIILTQTASQQPLQLGTCHDHMFIILTEADVRGNRP